MTDLGTYVEHEGRPAVRFVRTYRHPVERVWTAVSDPAELRRWFPSSVQLEPRAGGAISFSDDPYAQSGSGTVLVWEPPSRLAFTSGAGLPRPRRCRPARGRGDPRPRRGVRGRA